jgi:hypothetical protein
MLHILPSISFYVDEKNVSLLLISDIHIQVYLYVLKPNCFDKLGALLRCLAHTDIYAKPNIIQSSEYEFTVRTRGGVASEF